MCVCSAAAQRPESGSPELELRPVGMVKRSLPKERKFMRPQFWWVKVQYKFWRLSELKVCEMVMLKENNAKDRRIIT